MVAAPAAGGRAGALLESRAQVDTCVRLIHATPRRGALALAGGGAGALAWLLSTPGASARTPKYLSELRRKAEVGGGTTLEFEA